jgi:prephenate dehydratase
VFLTCTNSITKLESHPSSRAISAYKPWEYLLYLEFEGSTGDSQVQKALENVKEFASSLQILGSFPMFSSPTGSFESRIESPLGIGM